MSSYTSMTRKQLKSEFDKNQKKLAKLSRLWEETSWASLGESKESKTIYEPIFKGIKQKASEIHAEQREIAKLYKKENNGYYS